MISAVYKTLRSAMSSRYPFLTLSYYRERDALKGQGEAEPHLFFKSRDCLRQINKMAQSRAKPKSHSNFITQLPDKDLPDLTLCLVTYNSAEWLKGWTEAVKNLNYPRQKLKISWVDNNSSDNTAEILNSALEAAGLSSHLESMLKQDNRGFGAGQNLAVAQAKTDYILIINPDAELEPESLRFAVNYALADETDVSCWEFSQAPFEHPKYYDPVTLETSWNSHACILMKRSAFLKVGGYDTTLFLYGEDVELSYKLRAHGYKLRYLPRARIYHDTSPDPKRREDQMTRSIAANLLLRRRYGSYWDRAVGKVLITKSAFTSNIDQRQSVTKANEIYAELKPSFEPKRRHKTYFPFNGLEYDRRRLGRLTPIKAYKTPQTNQRGHTNPLVSIITRVHKTTDILYDAIACVENQTYSNVEHVIVFDGCDPINDDRIKAVSSNQTGRSEAANKGAKAANGDYLLFLDYDDLIFSDHIEGLVDRLNNKKEAVCAYSYSWEAMTKLRETGTVSHLAIQNKMETQFSPQSLAENNFFAIQSVLIKSDAFRHVGGFDTRLEYCEDWDLWQRLLKLGEFTPYKKLTSIYFTPASLKDRILRSWDMARQVQSEK